MPELALWLKTADANSFYEGLPSTEVKVLKYYFQGKLTPTVAATQFTENIDMEPIYNVSFAHNMQYLVAMTWDVSDPRGQIKIVKLLVAIRNLRHRMKKGWHSKREMDLRGHTDISCILHEFGQSIADEHADLWSEVLSPIREPLNLVRPESNDQWIILNTFLARSTAAGVCNVGLDRLGFFCDSFIEEEDVRENAVIFSVSVSGAAQYMIYSAIKVFELCEQRHDDMLCPLGWKKWMAGFKEAQRNPLIDASGKTHAKLAVAAMTEAELGWQRRHTLRGIDRVKRQGSHSEEFETKQGSACGIKRNYGEAFSDSLDMKQRT